MGGAIVCDTQYSVDYMVEPELLVSLRQEIRRGSVVLLSLLALRQPDYGYALLRTLEEAGVATDANTLYPLLRRLERQGLVTSEWVTEDPRPRKYYKTSADGEEVAGLLLTDWEGITTSLNHFQEGDKE